jgi:TonB-dependent receptor
MKTIETKRFRMTALAFAAAQVAMLYSYAAQAQTTDTTATADPNVTTVVVSGQRKALETAQRIKQEAEQVVDSVVADEAGKLPDKSITEVLQRVVGVTMDRSRSRSNKGPLGGDDLAFSAEGSGVQVRGLSWGSSTLNGRESFSAGWPGRELSWSDVPPELMAAVDVYKNPSSELVEGGISSQVNLRTRLPFDQKGAMGALSLSDNYAAFGKKNSPAASGLYSNRWKTSYGEFGALVDLSYNKFNSRYDSIGLSEYYPRTDVVPGKTVWAPVSTSWGTGTGTSERKGFYGALQWKRDNVETALTYFDSDFSSVDENHSIFTAAPFPYYTKYKDAKFDDKGIFQSGTLTYPAGYSLNQFVDGGLNMGTTANQSHVNARTRELAWNVKWRANENWAFQNDLQWVHATNNSYAGLINLGTFVPSMTMDVSGSLPKISFDPTATKFLADPNNYYWDSVQPALQRAKADLYAWKADAKYSFDHKVLRDLRFGVRVTERSSTKQDSAGSGWQSIGEYWAVVPTKVPGTLPLPKDVGNWQKPNFPYMSNPAFQVPGGVQTYQFPNFFNGKLGSPPQIVTATMPFVTSYWDTQYKQLFDMKVKQCQDAAAYTNDAQRAANCATTANKDWKPEGFTDDPAKISKHSEGTQAIYGTLRFGFDDWRFPVDGNTGVRIVRTKTTAHGYTIFKPSYSATTDPSVPRFGVIDEKLDVSGSHIDVIPSLNLKLNWTEKLQSRLALSKNIYRPGFDQLQEYITLDQKVVNDPSNTKIQSIDYVGNNKGNANLKPLKSTGLDLTLEWYPRDGQSLTAAFFAKKVKDIILTESYVRTLKDLQGNDQDFIVSGPANAAKLWEAGIEIAGMTYLDKLPVLDKALPDWMKGFGVSSNFTYLKGKQSLYHDFPFQYCPHDMSMAGNLFGCDTNGMPFKDLPVPYLSPRAFNFALMYDRGPVSLRLAYSWRDRTLEATGAYGAKGWFGTSSDPVRIAANNGVAPQDVTWGLPVWQEAVGQWDGGLNYKFNDNLYASANVSNLTNTITKQTQQQSFGNTLRSVYAPGRSFRVSLGYAFW